MKSITSMRRGPSGRNTVKKNRRSLAAASRPVFEGLEDRRYLAETIIWHADEGAGVVLNDASVGVNNAKDDGTLRSADWDAGRIGAGSVILWGWSYLETRDLLPFIGNTGSLAVWIKTTQVGSDTTYEAPGLAGGDQSGGASDIFWGILDASGRIGIAVGNSPAAKSLSPVNDGQWHHVAFTRDSATGATQVFVDGFLNATGSGPTGQVGAGYNYVGVMSETTSGMLYSYFEGNLDEISIYDRVISANEVGALFNPSGALPAAASSLAPGQVGARAIQLSWSDNSDNESGFSIERSVGGGAFTEIYKTGSNQTTYTDTGLTPGTAYQYRVKAFNPSASGATQYAPASNTLSVSTLAQAAPGTGTGLLGIYHDDGGIRDPYNTAVPYAPMRMGGRILTRVDPTVNFNWAGGSPMARMEPEHFSVRWIGQIQPLYTEYYTFYTNTDDGGKLTVNGLDVIVDDTYHGIGTQRTSEDLYPGGILLTGGQKYDIVFEMFEYEGDAGAQLRWSSFSTPIEIVPQSQLYTPVQSVKPAAVSSIEAAAGWDNNGYYENTYTTATVKWTDSNPAMNVLGYKILRSTTQAGVYTEIARVGGTQYIDTTVAPGKSYYYKVVAFNQAGDSPASAASGVVTTTALPVQGGLLATYFDGRWLTSPRRYVRVDGDIEWNSAATGNVRQFGVINWPDLQNDDGLAESPVNTYVSWIDDGIQIGIRWEGTFTPSATGNHTFYTRTDDAVRLYVNGQLLTSMPAGGFLAGRGAPAAPGEFGVITLNAGTAYPILMEYNQGGGGARAELRWMGPGMAAPTILTVNGVEGGATQVLSSRVNPVTAPSGLTGAFGAVTATLTWTDNSLNEHTNRVEMSTDGGTSWAPIANLAAGSNVGGAAGTMSYFVSGLLPSTPYSFRVVAVNSAGEAVSNVYSFTTKAAPPANASVAEISGDTDLSAEGKLSWSHWGYGDNVYMWNSIPAAPAPTILPPDPDFALITNVVETGGDNEATDTITAKWTGQTWNATVANEPVNGLAVGSPYTLGKFGHLTPAFVDRNHAFANDAAVPIPSYLLNGEYIMSGNDNRDNANYRLDVTVSVPVVVYMLIDNRLQDGDGATPPTFDATHMQWIVDEGWTATSNALNRAGSAARPDEVAIDEGADGSINQWYSVYYKSFPAGTFTLKQADNGGRNMYGVVVKIAGGTNLAPINATIGDVQALSTPGKTFSWTGGKPNPSVSGTDDAVALSGDGTGFQLTVPAQNYNQQLKVYVAVDGTAQGKFEASVSDLSIAPYLDTSLVGSGSVKTAVYTIDFQAENPNQILTVKWTKIGGSGNIYLSASTLIEAPPFAPSGLVATAVDGGGITVTWQDNSSNETSFVLQRKTAGGEFADVATLNPNTTSWTDEGTADTNRGDLVPNTEYVYRVRAVNTAGASFYSNEDSAIEDVPGAATRFVVGPDDGRVHLYWQTLPGVTYTVLRGTSAAGPFAPVVTTGALPDVVDPNVLNRVTYFYKVVGTKAGVQGDESVVLSATPSAVLPWVKVNFTNDTDDTREDLGDPFADPPVLPRPEGYVFDYGYDFDSYYFTQQYEVDGTFYRYGWGRWQDEDGDGVFTFDITYDRGLAYARDRDSGNTPGGDERLDSLNHFQKTDAGFINPNMWELELPNGEYRILIVSGDPDNNDSFFSLNAEDKVAVLGAPTSSDRFIGGVWDTNFFVDVKVTDGRLTISNNPELQALYSTLSNNKIAYIDIYKINTNFVPGVPTGLTGVSQNSAVSLSWSAVLGPDITYTVTRTTFNTTTGQVVAGSAVSFPGITDTAYVDATTTAGTSYMYTVKAVSGGQASAESLRLLITAMEGEVFARINFTNATGQDYEGYIKDLGHLFGPRNGYEYGWIVTDRNPGQDITDYARNHNEREGDAGADPPYAIDERYDSLNHMQKNSAEGTYWEIAVPNGTYYIHVVGGDIENTNSNIGYAFEKGTPNQVLTGRTPVRTVPGQATNDDGSPLQWRHVEYYLVVVVSDGRLTIVSDVISPAPQVEDPANPGTFVDPNVDAFGGGNNKISYIDINYIPPAESDWVIDLTPGNDTATLKRVGDDVKLLDQNGAEVDQRAFASLKNIIVNTIGGSDLVALDTSGGALVAAGRSITLNGGGEDDSVNLVGGALSLSDAGTTLDNMGLVLNSVANVGGKVAALNIAGAAKLNLGTSDLAIANGNLAAVVALIKSGALVGKAGNYLNLAAVLNQKSDGSALKAVFAGQPVGAADVLVKHTYQGDANLDGVVNADDYFLIDSGFISQKGGYYNGDFNNDGVTNADDYFLIDSAFIGQGAPMAKKDGSVLAELFSTQPIV